MRNTWQQVDTGDMAAKLTLRRYFLRRYHAAPPRVFDACQGTRRVWTLLEREFTLGSYWGVDLKKKKGRLKIDSARVLALPGMDCDVIDVDVYGSPWKHWLSLLPRLRRPTTVFLTLGRAGTKGSSLSKEETRALGVESFRGGHAGRFLSVFGRALGEIVTPILLAHANVWPLRIIEAQKAISRTSNAQYYGLRIETQAIEIKEVAPYNDDTDGVVAPSVSKHHHPVKEGHNV